MHPPAADRAARVLAAPPDARSARAAPAPPPRSTPSRASPPPAAQASACPRPSAQARRGAARVFASPSTISPRRFVRPYAYSTTLARLVGAFLIAHAAAALLPIQPVLLAELHQPLQVVFPLRRAPLLVRQHILQRDAPVRPHHHEGNLPFVEQLLHQEWPRDVQQFRRLLYR